MASITPVFDELDRLSCAKLAELTPLFADSPPEELGYRQGLWKAGPIELRTSIYRGDRWLSRLQVARVSSPGDAMASLTMIALPKASTGAPILGADLVAFGGELSLMILDLTPTVIPLDATVAEPLRSRTRGLREGSDALRQRLGEVPFSPDVLVARPAAGQATGVVAAFEVYLDAFVRQLHASAVAARTEPDCESRFRHSALDYFRKLSEVKRQAQVLSRLFGAEWTERYFQQLFFSETAIS